MDTLQKYKEKPLYEVPEHYFEQLQYDVMQRVAKDEKHNKKQKQWISSISVAASIAIIVALSYFIFLNKNTNEHFYVLQEIPLQEDSVISLEINHLAEATELFITTPEEVIAAQNPVPKNETSVETIAFRAVDYYVDDFETENFYNTIYDLECYYDY